MDKVAERMRSGFVPRGFDSLRISNAKFITIFSREASLRGSIYLSM